MGVWTFIQDQVLGSGCAKCNALEEAKTLIQTVRG